MDKDLTLINQEIDIDIVLKEAKPIGVIHAGAYVGGCLKVYEDNGIINRCWIEADPDTFQRLKENIPVDDVAINVAVCDKDDEMPFIRTNSDQSNSLLPLKKHMVCYPGIIEVERVIVTGRRIDTLISEGLIDKKRYNFLLMDLQGGEYYALKGFESNIDMIDHIVAEVNYEELYEGCMLIDDFDDYLYRLGFEKIIATKFTNFGWGDAYYKRICR